MLDLSRFWRRFLGSPWLQAGAMGSVASILGLALWAGAPATYTALDWSVYDFWMSRRAPIPVSASLVVVTRDPASDEAFGTGPWDRAILARIIAAAHEAGATALGLDHRLDRASPAHLGGPAGDALFLEALKTAGPLVLVRSPDPALASDAALLGHQSVTTHPDRVARAVPAVMAEDGHSAPAFGIALFDLFQKQNAPTTPTRFSSDAEPLLVNYVGDGTLAALPTVPVSAVWEAIERHEHDRLANWFNGKAVAFLTDQAPADAWLLPTGQSISGPVVHAHLLNMLLTGNRLCRLGMAGGALVTLLLAGLVSRCLLPSRGATGLLLAGTTVAIYGALLVVALTVGHLVLPVVLPMSAALFVLVGTAVWNQSTAHQRLMLLEQDMLLVQQEAAAVREALALRETRAEALREDLAAARTAVTQSTDQQGQLARAIESLRAELVEAQTQEEAARKQLAELEQQLHSLKAATAKPMPIGNVELDRLRDECRQLGLITRDTNLLRLYRDLKKGAKSALTVLLLGEPGTGKELFARAVHRLSPKAGKTFVAVNMAAISPELFESELFGHKKGSFTGATADRRGYFELANQGTIFLDEIGDLRLDHQSKLLRVLQDKSFYRVGATTPTTVDVRIVAATNRDLQRGVSEGWFREDLYFRLTGLVFRLPPLRERPDDIPLLTDAFLSDIAAQMGKPVPQLSHEALRALVEQEWKGNVRELRHCLEQAVTLNDGPILSKDSLRLTVDNAKLSGRAKHLLPAPAGDAAVLNCLRQHGFDMQATAKTLGWDRSTITQRLKGLCFQSLVESDGDQAKAALTIAGDPSHLRTVELKLMDYYSHLLSVIEPFATADEALADCKRRFKNLPDRHFVAVERLVRKHFEA
jgi:transcriptional regulator with PAS, ATPase and Fis domain